MIILQLILVSTLTLLVNAQDLFADFASSICVQRYLLDRSVVCQPNGDYAAKQCDGSGGCYCVTESGIMLDGTYFNNNDYVCRNVRYSVEYRYEQQNPGFNTTDMVLARNTLTRALLVDDRPSYALWDFRSASLRRDSRIYTILSGVLYGYNTRLDSETVTRNIKSSLGINTSKKANKLQLILEYDSVHEGECPTKPGRCREAARVCLSDSECQIDEICCETACGDRCVSANGETESTAPPTTTWLYSDGSSESTEPLGRSTAPTDSWYSTRSHRTEPLDIRTTKEDTRDTPRSTAITPAVDRSTTEPITSYDLSSSNGGEGNVFITDTTTAEITTEAITTETPGSTTTEPASTEPASTEPASTEPASFSSTEPDSVTTETSPSSTDSYLENLFETDPIETEPEKESTESATETPTPSEKTEDSSTPSFSFTSSSPTDPDPVTTAESSPSSTDSGPSSTDSGPSSTESYMKNLFETDPLETDPVRPADESTTSMTESSSSPSGTESTTESISESTTESMVKDFSPTSTESAIKVLFETDPLGPAEESTTSITEDSSTPLTSDGSPSSTDEAELQTSSPSSTSMTSSLGETVTPSVETTTLTTTFVQSLETERTEEVTWPAIGSADPSDTAPTTDGLTGSTSSSSRDNTDSTGFESSSTSSSFEETTAASSSSPVYEETTAASPEYEETTGFTYISPEYNDASSSSPSSTRETTPASSSSTSGETTAGLFSEGTTEPLREYSESSSSMLSKETNPITFFTDSMSTAPVTSTEPLIVTIHGNSIPMETEGLTTVPLSTGDQSTPISTSGSMLSLCERDAYLAAQEGRDGPICLDNGAYNPQQCDMERGICWCVNEAGLEIMGSMRYGSAGPCENYKAELTSAPFTTTVPLGDCWKAYQRAIKQQAFDSTILVPACQENGLYLQAQCQGTFCWCVNEQSGVMVNGTLKPGPIDCDIYINGLCPEFARQHGNCIDKCENDEHCYGTTKCCQTQCGRDCIYPQLPSQLKEGLCPAPESLNTIFERCNVECSDDTQCGGTSKCCFNGCGYECNEPIYDTNIYCKNIKTIYKGRVVDPREQYSEGDILTFECNHGYKLQGAEKIKCLESGEWETALPLCKRVSCGMPGSGQFVMIRGSDYWVGGVVEYHCYSGYELVGNSTATCLVNGRWNSEPPICQRRECPAQNELKYGKVYGNLRTYGNRIGFRCNYGYTLVGSEQRLCLSDGTWSGTDPRCVRGYYSRTRRHRVSAMAAADGSMQQQCQYEATDTIDYNGDCVEDIRTVECRCGNPNTITQTVKVVCQRGEYEFIERKVKIGIDCSCCE